MRSPGCVLALVVPCYNEEEMLEHTMSVLGEVLDGLVQAGRVNPQSFVVLVDDGSRDATWSLIAARHKVDSRVRGLKLTRNCGHQRALLAGLHYVGGKVDCAVSLDADLQDDVSVIPEMVEQYLEGYDVVFGVRRDRSSDTRFKRVTAQAYYKIMGRCGVELVYNHSDYRLLSSSVLASLATYPERNVFLRGMVPQLTANSTQVYYERKRREAGVSKYPLRKMLSFSWEGLTSFSVVPIRAMSLMGLAFFLMSLTMVAWIFVRWAAGGTVAGWASITSMVLFFSGIQLISLGIVGEYVAKVYLEVKGRPLYTTEKVLE